MVNNVGVDSHQSVATMYLFKVDYFIAVSCISALTIYSLSLLDYQLFCPLSAGGPRFGAPQQYTTKQALVNLLHHRQPPAGGQGYVQSRQIPMPRHMLNQKQQMIQQRLSGQGMQNRVPDNMYSNHSTPPAQLRHMGGTHRE